MDREPRAVTSRLPDRALRFSSPPPRPGTFSSPALEEQQRDWQPGAAPVTRSCGCCVRCQPAEPPPELVICLTALPAPQPWLGIAPPLGGELAESRSFPQPGTVWLLRRLLRTAPPEPRRRHCGPARYRGAAEVRKADGC